MNENDYGNDLTLEEFLFGTDSFWENGSPYNSKLIEGFNYLGPEADFSSSESFKFFRDELVACCSDFVWDRVSCCTVDKGAIDDYYEGRYQDFDIPTDEKIAEYFKKQKERYKNDD